MTIYESNLVTIKEKAPDIYDTLINDTPMLSVEIEPSDDPNNDIIIHNNCRCFVNSIYDIEAEMANMVKDIDKDTEVFVVFGLANGQIITYLQKHFPNIQSIFVIEPSLDMCKRFLSKVVFMDLFIEGINIAVAVNKTIDEISGELARLFLTKKNVVLIEHISYRTMFSDYYQRVSYTIIEYLRTQRFNIRTLTTSYLLWIHNSIVNSKHNAFILDSLFKYIEGKPAVIVSAGTSLKKNMHLLNKLKERAILFAGGSTVRVLSKNGITPNFRASIDAQFYQNLIFQNTDDENIPLLFRNMSNIDLVKNYNGPLYRAIIEDDYLWRYISSKKDLPKTILTATPSVSNFLFELLVAAKCDPIIFVGQDMCFYGDSKYADSGEEAYETKIQREMEMLDINGVKVTTELNYLQIKYSFDRQAKNCNARLINATEGGLGIEGAQNKTLEAVLNEDLTEELDFDIDEISEIEQLKYSYEENHQKVQEALQEIKEEAKELIGIYIEIFRVIDSYTRLKVNYYKESRLRREAELLDKLHEKLRKNRLYTEVALAATSSITQGFELKYSYTGTDKIKILDNKIAKAASQAEVIFKYLQEFQII